MALRQALRRSEPLQAFLLAHHRSLLLTAASYRAEGSGGEAGVGAGDESPAADGVEASASSERQVTLLPGFDVGVTEDQAGGAGGASVRVEEGSLLEEICGEVLNESDVLYWASAADAARAWRRAHESGGSGAKQGATEKSAKHNPHAKPSSKVVGDGGSREGGDGGGEEMAASADAALAKMKAAAERARAHADAKAAVIRSILQRCVCLCVRACVRYSQKPGHVHGKS